MNGVLINEVPKFLAPVPSEIGHTMHLQNTFDDTHSIITSLKLIGITRYFEVRTPN